MRSKQALWRTLTIAAGGLTTAAVVAALAVFVLAGAEGSGTVHGGPPVDVSSINCSDVYLAELEAPIETPEAISPGDNPKLPSLGSVAMTLSYTDHDTGTDLVDSALSTYNGGIPGVIAGVLPFPLPAATRCSNVEAAKVADVVSNPGDPGDASTAITVTHAGGGVLEGMMVYWNSDNPNQAGFYTVLGVAGTSVTVQSSPVACSGAGALAVQSAPGDLHACEPVETGLDPIAFLETDVTTVGLDGDAPRQASTQCPNFTTFEEGSCYDPGSEETRSLSCGVSTGAQEGASQNAWTRTEIITVRKQIDNESVASFGIAMLFNPTTPKTCADIASETNRSTNISVIWTRDSASVEGAIGNWDSDYDEDGCLDWQELSGPPVRLGSAGSFTGGRDGFNPNDCRNDMTGVYTAQLDVVPVSLSSNTPVAGSYVKCQFVVEEDPDNTLNGPIYCYIDDPGLTVNPQDVPAPNAGASTCGPAPASQCGDGFTGSGPPIGTAGPPGPYGDIDDEHFSFSGTYDPNTDLWNYGGCIGDVEGTQGPNIYMKFESIDRMTGNGTADIWRSRANCTDPGATTPTYDDVNLQVARHASDVSSWTSTNPSRYDYEDYDYDKDGCPTVNELGNVATSGGLRDPYSENDRGDVNHVTLGNGFADGFITVSDILTIAGKFGAVNPFDPVSVASDDGFTLVGSNFWNHRGDDGNVTITDDILGTAQTFGHNCS